MRTERLVSAMNALRTILAAGPLPVPEIYRRMKGIGGFGKSYVRAAKKELGCRSICIDRTNDQDRANWLWSLPDSDPATE